MGETRVETLVIDGTDDAPGRVARGVQEVWREQNAAFRRKMLTQLRPRGESRTA